MYQPELRTGECVCGSWIDINKPLLGVGHRGIDISFIDLFLYIKGVPPPATVMVRSVLFQGFRPPATAMVCNSPVYFYPLRYRRSILTAVMLGALLSCYRVAGNGSYNNRRLALWSRYNSARYVNLLVNAFNSVKQLTHYCVNNTIDLVFGLYTPVFTVCMNSRRIHSISRQLDLQPSLLAIHIPRGFRPETTATCV
jgi:hypothetical protein